MKSRIFAALLACAIAIAAAQDTTPGGQEGSRMTDGDPSIATAPDMATSMDTASTATTDAAPAAPTDAAPAAPTDAAPAAPTDAAPAAPTDADSHALPVPEAPNQAQAANPSPRADSDSGSFANANNIESPVTKKSQRTLDSSRSESTSSGPSERSSAPMLAAAVGAWTLAGVCGFAATL